MTTRPQRLYSKPSRAYLASISPDGMYGYFGATFSVEFYGAVGSFDPFRLAEKIIVYLPQTTLLVPRPKMLLVRTWDTARTLCRHHKELIVFSRQVIGIPLEFQVLHSRKYEAQFYLCTGRNTI